MTRIEYLKLLSKGYKDSDLVVPVWINEELHAATFFTEPGNLPFPPWQVDLVSKLMDDPNQRWMLMIPRMMGKQRIIDITAS
jgi:hypothetical protein